MKKMIIGAVAFIVFVASAIAALSALLIGVGYEKKSMDTNNNIQG